MSSLEKRKLSPTSREHHLPERSTKVAKTHHKPSKPTAPGLLYRNGLLKTKVAVKSESMRIAKRNSTESPLLRFPGEIRSKIWQFALGYQQIDIFDKSGGQIWHVKPSHDARPIAGSTTNSQSSVKPTFALPRVCRQIYVEAAAIIYTLNTFSFSSQQTLDGFIRHRALGQRRLIISIDVPFNYFRLYHMEFRDRFRIAFPNIKRIGIHILAAQITQRVLEWTWTWKTPQREPIGDAKKKIEDFVKDKEGNDLVIGWHGRFDNGRLNLLKAPARLQVIIEQNDAQSPLLRLPPELLNKIFEYTMGNYDIYIVTDNNLAHSSPALPKLSGLSRSFIPKSYNVWTNILPRCEVYRPARSDEDLPNPTLPRI
ncbi:hypothetical protein TW65_05538 [Stemphylium lycopersici]|nr:hypothetical protein TW65_05538 [Stemphylium lycopersici]